MNSSKSKGRQKITVRARKEDVDYFYLCSIIDTERSVLGPTNLK
jgi:hypothetical protein